MIPYNWVGGHITQRRVRRPVGTLARTGDHVALMARIHELRREGMTAPTIAAALNAEGWVTPRLRNPFNDRLVRAMLERHGSVPRGPKPPPREIAHGWWIEDLARELKMSPVTLYGWMRRGWVKGRRVDGQWALIADGAELRRLRRLRRDHPSPKQRTP